MNALDTFMRLWAQFQWGPAWAPKYVAIRDMWKAAGLPEPETIDRRRCLAAFTFLSTALVSVEDVLCGDLQPPQSMDKVLALLESMEATSH